jgi:hypothetical protein
MYSYSEGQLRMDKLGDFIECDVSDCETVGALVTISQTSPAGGFGSCVVTLYASVLRGITKAGFVSLGALTMADPNGTIAAQTCKGYTRARLVVTTTGTAGGVMTAAMCGYAPFAGVNRSIVVPPTMGN